MLKFYAILLVFLGEILAIYAETFVIKHKIFSVGFWSMIFLMCVGGVFLVFGYVFGYRAFHNLWYVTAISIGTLLIVEPLLLRYLLGQIPTTGSLVSFTLGVFGILVATLF